MEIRTLYGLLRLGIALACLSALIGRYVWAWGFGASTAANYFGYLTIHSNIVFTVVTLLAAIAAFTTKVDARWLTTLRAAALTATVTSGVVFALIMYLASINGSTLDVDWSDHVLHFWLPALALAEWILAPHRGRAHWRAIPFVLAYVVIFGVFTLVRGSIAGWYPYFFLDPRQVGSVVEQAGLCAVALAFFAVIASAMIGLRPRVAVDGNAVSRKDRSIGRQLVRS